MHKEAEVRDLRERCRQEDGVEVSMRLCDINTSLKEKFPGYRPRETMVYPWGSLGTTC